MLISEDFGNSFTQKLNQTVNQHSSVSIGKTNNNFSELNILFAKLANIAIKFRKYEQ